MNGRVLLVDDDRACSDTLARVLIWNGFEVVVASDGIEAIRRFGEQPCDAVIIDILMPERDGLETIVHLQRRDPRVPIIAMSGGVIGNGFIYLDTAKRLGAAATLEKPFSPSDLIPILKQVISSSRNSLESAA